MSEPTAAMKGYALGHAASNIASGSAQNWRTGASANTREGARGPRETGVRRLPPKKEPPKKFGGLKICSGSANQSK
jgi:hypothetical protein